MNSNTPSLADLEARLTKLERQNRRMKRLGLLFLLIAGSGFLLAQAPRKPARAAPAPATPAATYDTLVVRRLELRDKAGKLRGGLMAEGETPMLGLSDIAPKTLAALGETGLALWGQTGNGMVWLQTGKDGPYLSLADAQQFKAVVGVTELETIRTGESHTTSAATVTLFGKDGKVIWRAP